MRLDESRWSEMQASNLQPSSDGVVRFRLPGVSNLGGQMNYPTLCLELLHLYRCCIQFRNANHPESKS
ncbi:hypothetical protein ACH3XW_28195 [Acanthocheilonema viteae]